MTAYAIGSGSLYPTRKEMTAYAQHQPSAQIPPVNLTDTELNVALAKAMGWREHQYEFAGADVWEDPSGFAHAAIPDFANDMNAHGRWTATEITRRHLGTQWDRRALAICNKQDLSRPLHQSINFLLLTCGPRILAEAALAVLTENPE